MNDAIRRGEVISDKYRIEGVLGEGAMGIVYAAHHLQLDEPVALKVLRHELAAYPDAVSRFSREARAAAKIKNEHVTRVFDVGELSDGTPYLVMESLDGEDLARWLASRGALRLEEAIAFILQACEALAEAHVLGIVHRDLKPSNLFCSRRPDGALSIKVLDFGISKVAALATSMSDPGRSSGARGTVGSPFYMSPEQMESSADVDHRTDIWALGVILFELLTTALPFEGESLPEVCIKVATLPPRRVRDLRSGLPEEVEATILKCLAKRPQDRFENLAEFAGSLFPFAGRTARLSIERIVQVSRRARSAAAGPTSERLQAHPSSDATTMRPLGGTVPPARADASGHLPYLGLGGAAVVALGAILFWTRPVGDRSRTDAEPAEKAPSHAAAPPKVQPIPIKAENLPKADEPLSPAVAFPPARPEPPAPQVAIHPAALSVAPAASAVTAVDDTSENKPQRHHVAKPESSREHATAPAKREPEPAPIEPGSDMRSRRQRQPRPIDEADPYAR